jgi:EpsD family peptidyl-prolyl cis-trans isomerase
MFCKINRLLVLLIGATLVLTACGKTDQAKTNEKTETQVVAKVNGDEISIHQVNFQLGRMTQNNQAQLTEAQGKQAAKQILARLVDQQLLKQQALEAKLDRDPRILQALEASKNEILAQAYLEQLMIKAAKPSTTEIETFYTEHPELFEKRRIFRLQELVVDVKKEQFEEVENGLKTIKNVNEMAAWLKSKNYPFTANSNVRAAEQLPLELLKKIQPLKDGELMAVPTGRSLNIIHLAASQSAPIARDKATPIIEQYFLNQNKTSLAKKEMVALNTKAHIEYIGAFADMKKSDSTSAEESISNDKAATSTGLSKKPASTIQKTDQNVAKPIAEGENMDKGLAGL